MKSTRKFGFDSRRRERGGSDVNLFPIESSVDQLCWLRSSIFREDPGHGSKGRRRHTASRPRSPPWPDPGGGFLTTTIPTAELSKITGSAIIPVTIYIACFAGLRRRPANFPLPAAVTTEPGHELPAENTPEFSWQSSRSTRGIIDRAYSETTQMWGHRYGQSLQAVADRPDRRGRPLRCLSSGCVRGCWRWSSAGLAASWRHGLIRKGWFRRHSSGPGRGGRR